METIRLKEMMAQAELYKHLGAEHIESLSDKDQMDLFAKWRDIIIDWEGHHNGEPPDSEQMKWIFGVWVDMEPGKYIEQLAK